MMSFKISPPLLNSANPWATTLEDLETLYNCSQIGAVTTRTCTLEGFLHDDKIHQYAFFDADTHRSGAEAAYPSSLNTLGYSPIPLHETLANIKTITDKDKTKAKPFVVSITGSAEEVQTSVENIAIAQKDIRVPLFVEVNLSCPNITGKPPPAFSQSGISQFLKALSEANGAQRESTSLVSSFLPLVCGIKTPPYTNPENFKILEAALLDFPQALGFITATNTLGCSLLLDENGIPVLDSADGSGIGGMAGAPLHPLALGNVRLIRKMLDSHQALAGIKIIGVGGVSDQAGFRRMKAAGADFVGVGSALGQKGVTIFKDIQGS
jgi:dihydroorotate dehydrogenase (fumarate)